MGRSFLIFGLVASLAACGDARRLTVEECREAGGDVLGIAGVSSGFAPTGRDFNREDGCPGGRTRLGAVEAAEDPNGGVCCAIPPLLTVTACGAAGGEPVGDPGDGSSFRNGCPGGRRLLGWLTGDPGLPIAGEGGICCAVTR
jgi:hypothetical protein